MRNRKHNKGNWQKVLILTGFILAVSSFFSWLIIESAKDILGMKSENIQTEIIIPKGATTTKIVGILKKKNIIQKPFIFKLYSKLKHADGTYRNGKFILNSTMSYNDIIYSLQNLGKRTDIVCITIPEGFTLNQIAKLLDEKGVCRKLDFLNEVDNKEFASKALNKAEKNKLIRYRLEGYLFPDTYEFIKNDKPEYIISAMLKNCDEKLFNGLKIDQQNTDYNLHEILTLASIVQKESTSYEVMKKVASVFFNRLNNPSVYLRLESDVTILYVNTDIKPSLEFKNQKMYDSYNTYVCKGLPIGPICNPGLEAIDAVLNPDETDYNYFLTDIDENYYWAKTLQEHNNNIYKAEKIGEVKGLDTK